MKLVTGPAPPAGKVAITNIALDQANGTPTIVFNAQVGVTYFVFASDDLVSREEIDDLTAEKPDQDYTETGVSSSERFYRVEEE